MIPIFFHWYIEAREVHCPWYCTCFGPSSPPNGWGLAHTSHCTYCARASLSQHIKCDKSQEDLLHINKKALMPIIVSNTPVWAISPHPDDWWNSPRGPHLAAMLSILWYFHKQQNNCSCTPAWKHPCVNDLISSIWNLVTNRVYVNSKSTPCILSRPLKEHVWLGKTADLEAGGIMRASTTCLSRLVCP